MKMLHKDRLASSDVATLCRFANASALPDVLQSSTSIFFMTAGSLSVAGWCTVAFTHVAQSAPLMTVHGLLQVDVMAY